MLYWALVFFLVALIAAFCGFFWLAGVAMLFAKVLFVLFLILFLMTLLSGLFRRHPR